MPFKNLFCVIFITLISLFGSGASVFSQPMDVVFPERENSLAGDPNPFTNQDIVKENKADLLMQRGDSLLDQSQNDEALGFYNKALMLYREIDNARKTANCLYNIGLAYYGMDNYSLSIDYYQQAQTLLETAADPLLNAHCSRRIGWSHYQLDDYKQAIWSFDEARKSYNSLNKMNFEADCLWGKSLSLLYAEDYDAAIATFEQAIKLYQNLGDNLQRARCIYYEGYANFLKDDYQKSIPYFKTASSMFRSEKDSSRQANSLHKWASANYYLENYQEAIKIYEQARDIYRAINDATNLANSLAGLGDSYFKIKNYEASSRQYEQAIALLRSTINNRQLALCLLMYGHGYYNLESYEAAVPYYLEADSIFVQLGDADHAAKCSQSLGDTYQHLSQYQRALEWYLKVVNVFRGNTDPSNYVACLKNIANCYYNLGDYENACDYYLNAARQYHALADTSSEANCIRDGAECYFKLKLYREACAQYAIAAGLYLPLKDKANEAKCYFNSGNGYYNLEKYPDALEQYNKAKECYASVSKPSGMANCILSMGDVHLKLNLLPEALEAYQQAIQPSKKAEDKTILAAAYVKLANTQRKWANKYPDDAKKYFSEAEANYAEARKLYESHADNHGIAECYDGIAGRYFDQSEYEKAKEYYANALDYYRKSDEPKNQGISLYNLGAVHYNLDQFGQAIDLINQSLAIYQDINFSGGIADCHSMLGHCFIHLEPPQIPRAKRNVQQALALYEKLPDRDINGEAFSYRGIGDIYSYEGQYAEAKTNYLKALELYGSVTNFKSKTNCKLYIGDAEANLINFNAALSWYGDARNSFEEAKDYDGVAYAFIKIGKLHYRWDQYENALSYFESALALAKEHEIQSSQLICFIDMGNIYNEVNLPDTALVLYEQARKLAETLKDTTNIGTSLLNLGNIYYDKRDYVKAQQNFEQALEIAQRKPESHYMVTCLIDLGNLFCKRELIEQGIANYRRALEISERSNDPVGSGLCLNNLAIVEVDQGRYTEAMNKLMQAEKILQENYLRSSLVTVHSNKGFLYEKQGQYHQAFACYKQATDIVEDIRTGLKRESLLRSFIESKADIYDHIVTLLLTQLNDIETAFDYVERSKHLDLQELYRRKVFASRDPDLISVWNQYEKKRLEAEKFERDLENLNKQPASKRNDEELRRISKLYTESKTIANQLAERLSSDLLMRSKQLQKLQPKIPDDAMFIMYHASQNVLFAFLITNSTFQVRTIDVPRDTIYQKIQQYRELIGQDVENARQLGKLPNIDNWQAKTVKSLCQISSELYSYLIGPIENYLTDKKLLTFIPSGQLYYLPIHALAHQKSDGKLEFVIERWEVNYLSSLGFLSIAEAKDKKKAEVNSSKVVAFANADGTLPQTETEVQTVKVFAPDAEIFRKDEATEELALQKSKTCSILILSTHCNLNNKNPYQTYIKLAPSGKYDGLWHVGEVQELSCPNLDFVILSSCATAIGSDNPGQEINNFAESFSTAGASSIIATLWPVADISSTELMKNFYRNYFKQKLSKVEALRQAQLTLLSDPQFRHPLAWAPFVLIGDWK